jgi:hypothetical protein
MSLDDNQGHRSDRGSVLSGRRSTNNAISIAGDEALPVDEQTEAPDRRALGHFAELARVVADEVVTVLIQRGIVGGADDLLRRGRKENGTWRSKEGASACSARTHDEGSGESSWLAEEAKGLIETMRRKQKRRR